MMTSSERTGGRAGARPLEVWDPLVRLVHWGLALTILANAVLTDPEGDLHAWLGYIAAALIATRLAWAVIGPRPARFSAFPPSPRRAAAHVRAMMAGDRTVHLSHNPLGALMVYNLWLSVIVLGATGYMMTTFRFFGVDWVEETHELVFGWLIASVVLHVAGVAFDSWRSDVNLVRAMIDGRKRIPEGRDVE
jgi:cytochrome b